MAQYVGLLNKQIWRVADLRQPDFYEKDVWTAIVTACRTEGWRPTHTSDRRRQMLNE